MTIEEKRVVSIHYKLTDDDGQVLDTSEGGDALNYLHGAGNLIPGLESELLGKSQGDRVQVTVQPTDAYGDHDPELIQKVPNEAFQGVEKIEAGMQFTAQGPDGATRMVTVRDVAEDGVTVDGNHPLAGQVLHFDVQIEGIREATDEELKHGHAH